MYCSHSRQSGLYLQIYSNSHWYANESSKRILKILNTQSQILCITQKGREVIRRIEDLDSKTMKRKSIIPTFSQDTVVEI